MIESEKGMKTSDVAKWEIRKHMAIELYPMSLKKQQEYMRGRAK